MSLDPQIRDVLKRIKRANHPPFHDLTPQQAREQFARTMPALDLKPLPVARVLDMAIDGVPVRVFTPAADQPLPLLMWLHGGGFVVGGLETCDAICRYLAVNAEVVVVAVDYRLAPEHPFPAAVEDCWQVLKALPETALAWGGDPARLAVGGDSAGGTLSAVMTHFARDVGGPSLWRQLLVYPGTSPTQESDSHRAFGEDYLLEGETIEWFYHQYLPDEAARFDPRFAPLMAQNLQGLPPGLVIVAGHDPLRDEGIAYARRLQAAGNEVELVNYEGAVHGFINMGGAVALAVKALERLVATLQRDVDRSPERRA